MLTTKKELPGILQLFDYAPHLERPLRELVEQLLRGESTLRPGFREFIAASVAWAGGTQFCFLTHGYAASELLGYDVVEEIENDYLNNVIEEQNKGIDRIKDPEMMLLYLAAAVAVEGSITPDPDFLIHFKKIGGTEKQYHDAMAIASTFVMFSHYMNMTLIECPDRETCKKIGIKMAKEGYLKPVTVNDVSGSMSWPEHFDDDGDL